MIIFDNFIPGSANIWKVWLEDKKYIDLSVVSLTWCQILQSIAFALTLGKMIDGNSIVSTHLK